MAALRIKGQETSVVIIEDGEPQLIIDTIRNTDISFDLEQQEEGYLGETFNRMDSVFNTMSIKLEAHMSTRDLILLADKIVTRAKRRAGGVVRVDILTTFVFPEGDLIGIGIRDVQFAPIPIGIASRTDYVNQTLDGKASEYELVQ